MARAVFACVSFVVVVAGCAEPPVPLCETQATLVDPAAWTYVPNADDPLWPAPEGAALCSADEIQVQSFGEDDAVEVDTRFGCGWATVAQPIAVDLKKGDEIQIRVFYFSQASFPEDTAEVAIAIDGDVVSSTIVDIPTSSDLIAPRVVVDRDIAAGATALFHVGNHGDNSWNLIELSRIDKAPCPAEE